MTWISRLHRSLFIGSLLLMWLHLAGQIQGLDLLGRKHRIIVPFEIQQGFIIVQVEFENVVPLKMIFDTGAENTILFDKEICQVLGVRFERQISITGSDLDSMLLANIARSTKMRLESCRKVDRDIIVLEKNDLLLKEKLGIDVNGILGGSFFSNLVVTIDYRRKQIILSHPAHFKEPGDKFTEFDIDVRSKKPYLMANVTHADNSQKLANFLLDTGASLPFLIHANTDTSLLLPDRVMVGNVGFGLSGVMKGYLGHTKMLKFGDFQFENIATSFQDIQLDSLELTRIVRNGIIGNNLLRRFKVIINYPAEKLYLDPVRNYNKEFDYDKSGLTIFAVGPNLNQYFIVSVIVGSPAYKAGIRPGDIIHSIGARRASSLDLQDITRRLAQKTGKKIKMRLIRNGEKFKTEFILSDWFEEI